MGQTFVVYLILFVISLVGYLLLVKRGKGLKEKFYSLGNLQGKSKSEIIAVCGNYTNTIRVDDKLTCKWAQGEFGIAVTFDANDKVVSFVESNTTFWG